MIRDTSGRKCTWRRPHLRPRVHSRKADAAAIDAIVTRSNGDIRRRKGSGMTSNGFRFLPTSTVYHPVPQATRELVGMPPLVCQPRCVLSIHCPFQVLIATATATVRIGEYGSLHCRDPPNPVSDSHGVAFTGTAETRPGHVCGDIMRLANVPCGFPVGAQNG